MTFKEQVQKLSSKEIIMSMVNGLRDPNVKVDMRSFGGVEYSRGVFGLFKREVCIGCAATNAICNLTKVKFTPKNIKNRSCAVELHLGNMKAKQRNLEDEAEYFLHSFEAAINDLRKGSVEGYNFIAVEEGFAKIEIVDMELPNMQTYNFKLHLDAYEELANRQ